MKKLFILFILLLLTGCTSQVPEIKPLEIDLNNLKWDIEANIALSKAREIYQQAIIDEMDLTNGPCLSNNLHGNMLYPETLWVLDIAHNPRQEMDDLPENQCSVFREKKASNFIELDKEGNLIQIYSPYL